jgi:hypothetical protein
LAKFLPNTQQPEAQQPVALNPLNNESIQETQEFFAAAQQAMQYALVNLMIELTSLLLLLLIPLSLKLVRQRIIIRSIRLDRYSRAYKNFPGRIHS